MPQTDISASGIGNLNGTDIYDQIMAKIEPELMSAVLPTLTEKYKNETPEQAKSRGERYAKAFEEYDRQYASFVVQLDAKVHAFERQAVASVEKESLKEESSQLSNLESQISDI